MLENDAIKIFKELLNVPCEMLVKYDLVTNEEQKQALVKIRIAEEMAIQALEEIQQYRAIGTVKQFEWCKDASHWKELFKDKLEQYEAIGTVEDINKVLSFLGDENKRSIIDDLKLLNEYKEIGTVEEIKSFFNENRKAGYKHGYSDGYVKAIDEFAEKITEYCSMSDMNRKMIEQLAEQLAEQMKEGGSHDRC